MKWVIGMIGLTGMMLLVGGMYRGAETPAYAQGNGGKQRIVTASGTGSVQASADLAKVTFAVQVVSADLKSAQDDISTQTSKALAGIKVLKLKGMDVKLAPLAITSTGENKAKPTYHLTQTFQVTLTSDDPATLVENANTVVTAAIANGATAAPMPGELLAGAGPQVTFSVVNDATKRREALQLAVQDALKNAQAIAKGADLKLVDIVGINEPGTTHTGQLISELMGGGQLADRFGDREIVVRVTVMFGY